MITQNDIKLLESQRMQDTDDGGGRAVGTVVLDGGENNIFPDISEADRVNGRVNFRKLFMAIQTSLTETYFGSNIIIAEKPDDPNVSLTLFSTGQPADTRRDAQTRVESYTARGPKYQGYLFSTQIEGAKSILILQRPELELPAVGSTLVLLKDPDTPDQKEQFVQITDVTANLRAFTSSSGGDFVRNVITVEISQALLYDFIGGDPSPFDELDQTIPSRVHETLVADASRYFGTVDLDQPVTVGDLAIKAESIFTQLVPSAQAETAITDARPNSLRGTPVELTDSDIQFIDSVSFTPGSSYYLSTGVLPGSLNIATTAGVITDKGGFLIVDASTEVGVIDYASGVLSFTGTSTFSGSKTVAYRPATSPARNVQSIGTTVTPASRSQIFVFLLDPRPAPGTLFVSYRAQGQWITLRDDGSGAVTGAATGLGSGTINFATGDLNVTLGALPDVDTEIILGWATAALSQDRSGGTGRLEYVAQLSNEAIEGATVTLSWPDGDGGTFTANENGSGNLVGDCDGTVNYRTGTVVFQPDELPPIGAELTINYQSGTPLTATIENPVRNGDQTITISLGETNVLPGTIELDYNAIPGLIDADPSTAGVAQLGPVQIRIEDDGAGGLTSLRGFTIQNGSVDYAAGTVTFTPDVTVPVPVPVYVYSRGGTILVDGVPTPRTAAQYLGRTQPSNDLALFPGTGGTIVAKFRTSDSPAAQSESFTINALDFDLTDNFGERVATGGVLMQVSGNEHVDRSGRIDSAIDRTTGAGTQAGTVDYQTGIVTLTAWTPGDLNTVEVDGLSTSVGVFPVESVVFRTPAAPIRPGSLSVQFQISGEEGLTTVTADVNGDIVGSNVVGTIDYDTGIVRLWFGENVTASGNESEPWYEASLVDLAGNIFRPALALADTIRFGAVAFTFLPLDANLLGLDPVRLPSDGRVPIFRPGDMLVIHNTQTLAGATYANTDTADTGRTRLERVRPLDAAGDAVDPARYTVDLDTGIVTWDDVSGLAQPITIEHMVADAMLVTEAQITGDLTVSRPASHDYPVPGSYVSSALQFGDQFSRETGAFEQETWAGEWSDSIDGDAPDASYDIVNNPIQVQNNGAITERWAIVFTGVNSFEVIGETVGQIAVGDITNDQTPINPQTGQRYFTILAAGWGSGWSPGNVLRFNTIGSQAPFWLLRTTQQGPPGDATYNFKVLTRGDVDA